MDIKDPGEATDLMKALKWIGEGNKARDLTKKNTNVSYVSFSLTVSTDEELAEEQNDEYVLNLEEFSHIIGYIDTN